MQKVMSIYIFTVHYVSLKLLLFNIIFFLFLQRTFNNMACFTCSWKVILIWWIDVIPFVASPPLLGGYLLKDIVTFIPRNEREFIEQTKNLKCAHSEGCKLHPTYVISPFHNETRIGCFCEMKVTVKKCLEYNFMRDGTVIMQPSNYAPCGDFNLTPCNDYSSTKSYELFQCFEIYGGIPPPKIEIMQETDYSFYIYIGISFASPCIVFLLIILIIPICIQMGLNKVSWGDFWKSWFSTFKWLYSRPQTTDVILDSTPGQLPNTDVRSKRHVRGTQPFQSTDEPGPDNDTLKNSKMEIDDLENLAIDTENDTFL